jgi:hypothetical protein
MCSTSLVGSLFDEQFDVLPLKLRCLVRVLRQAIEVGTLD